MLVASQAKPSINCGLSPRQWMMLLRLLKGDSEKEAASALGISPHTAHVYIKALYRSFNVQSRSELLARFVPRLGADELATIVRGADLRTRAAGLDDWFIAAGKVVEQSSITSPEASIWSERETS